MFRLLGRRIQQIRGTVGLNTAAPAPIKRSRAWLGLTVGLLAGAGAGWAASDWYSSFPPPSSSAASSYSKLTLLRYIYPHSLSYYAGTKQESVMIYII